MLLPFVASRVWLAGNLPCCRPEKWSVAGIISGLCLMETKGVSLEFLFTLWFQKEPKEKFLWWLYGGKFNNTLFEGNSLTFCYSFNMFWLTIRKKVVPQKPKQANEHCNSVHAILAKKTFLCFGLRQCWNYFYKENSVQTIMKLCSWRCLFPTTKMSKLTNIFLGISVEIRYSRVCFFRLHR